MYDCVGLVNACGQAIAGRGGGIAACALTRHSTSEDALSMEIGHRTHPADAKRSLAHRLLRQGTSQTGNTGSASAASCSVHCMARAFEAASCTLSTASDVECAVTWSSGTSRSRSAHGRPAILILRRSPAVDFIRDAYSGYREQPFLHRTDLVHCCIAHGATWTFCLPIVRTPSPLPLDSCMKGRPLPENRTKYCQIALGTYGVTCATAVVSPVQSTDRENA